MPPLATEVILQERKVFGSRAVEHRAGAIEIDGGSGDAEAMNVRARERFRCSVP
jgi:hypothetical protein